LLNTENSFSTADKREKTILLVFPGKYKAPDPQVPLSILHLAASLEQDGFAVKTIDMRLQDYRHFDLGAPLFVGISTMSGMQIRYALQFARYFRAKRPQVPIVWGGVHPSLLPEQTASHELVDIVVRGEGELIIKDLANHLLFRKPLEQVNGITYKSQGKIKSNPDGPKINLDDIPIQLPYNLLQINQYPLIKAGRFHLQTSRGCPHRCGFCYNMLFNNQKWRGKTAKRMIHEIEYLLKRFPSVKKFDFVDDNFFVDKTRIENFCKGLLEKKLDVKWRANCRFDYLAGYDSPFLGLLEKTGCVELDFGGESGSARLQQFVHKDVTAEQILKSLHNLKVWAPTIEPYVSWISGLPYETDEDLSMTFDLMDEMHAVNPKVQHYSIFVFTPFPSPLLADLPNRFKQPSSLEEWSNIAVFHFNPPWHSKKYTEKLHAVSAVTRYAFYPEARVKERGLGFCFAYGLLSKLARYRWRHRNFSYPIELKIIDAIARKTKGYL
jgi:radical SAM superfamily enzyme YgiQ (UPF0313 family)